RTDSESKKSETETDKAIAPIVESQQPPVEETETAATEKPVTAVGNGAQFSIERADFPSPYYLNLLRTRIQKKWRPPPRRNRSIQAIVSFRILRSGRFMDVGLARVSGNGMFDLAAQRAIHAAGPLPPLPANFSGPYLTVHIEFEGL
ncbi:TonB C-terminal domain-containing protein, partial [bacterium]|nr:TonB C-terminal domain-containing protein [bacterium]